MPFDYNAKLERVVDGDTVWLDVDLGFGLHAHFDFRLYGINTPEVIGATRTAGLAAKAEIERLLALGTLRIETFKSDKYGRWLAKLYVKKPGVEAETCINDALVQGKFAQPYFGVGPKS